MPDLTTPIALVRPGRIAFGPGTVAEVGRWIRESGCRRTLVVADAFNAGRVGLLEIEGDVTVFGEIKAEPDTADLAAVTRVALEAGAEVVVGFGGGSAMDLAKLAAVLPGSGQVLADVVGVERVRAKRARLVQVPTTAGTGSEAGTRALVTDPVSFAKLAVQSDHMLADLAAIDPALTLSMPAAITAATGVDALTHCVEAFTNKKAHPTIDVYALEGIRLVGKWLPRAIADGQNLEARAGMALASLYGGYCLGPVNTAAGHALAYPLGTRFHVPHGAANAAIFPHVLGFNVPAVPERTAAILEALGLPATTDPIAVRMATHDWCSNLSCTMRLRDFGVAEPDLAIMAAEAHAIRRLLDNNPRDLSVGDIQAIYAAAL
jgi:alcohol dehydrogenase class IV